MIPIAEFKQLRTDGRLVSSYFARNMITLPVKEIGTLTVNRMYLFLILIRKRTWFRHALIKGWNLKCYVAWSVLELEGLTKYDLTLIARVRKACLIMPLLKTAALERRYHIVKAVKHHFARQEVDLMRSRTLTCTFSSELAFSFKTSSENSAW